jgi:tetratricopeptide (TPR) repeat protein
LLASALELLATQQFSTALPLAASAVTLDPTNIIAHYLLANIQLQLEQFSQAFATTEQALTLRDAPGYSQYVARLWYQKGVLLLQRRDFIAAETALQQASKLANQQKDWLYLAYSHAMLAQLKLAQQQYEQALPLLNAALQYQQILNCPLGIAQSELDLAGYFMLTGQTEQAKQRYQASSDLVQQRGLSQLKPALLEFETHWLSKSPR